MDLSQKYVYTVWKKQSFTKAAKALYVSQPSLSAMVAKLEGELGFKIFNRATRPISATSKGKIYLNYLDNISAAENQLKDQLSSVIDESNQHLTVGGNNSLAQIVFPKVCQQLTQKYPEITLSLDVEATLEKLKNKFIDLQFTFFPSEKEYTVVPVRKDRIFVAIHKTNPMAESLSDYALSFQEISSGNIPPEKEITDFSLLSRIPFIKSGVYSDTDKRLSTILKNHLTAPCSIINSRTFDVRYRMMQSGLGAIFATEFFLKQFSQGQNEIFYFALQSPHSYRTTYIQYREDVSNPKLIEEFISIVLDCCKS